MNDTSVLTGFVVTTSTLRALVQSYQIILHCLIDICQATIIGAEAVKGRIRGLEEILVTRSEQTELQRRSLA